VPYSSIQGVRDSHPPGGSHSGSGGVKQKESRRLSTSIPAAVQQPPWFDEDAVVEDLDTLRILCGSNLKREIVSRLVRSLLFRLTMCDLRDQIWPHD